MKTKEEELETEKEAETELESNGSGVVVIAGDALPTLGNFLKTVPPALHVNRGLAIASLQRIIALADVVIPGHDFAFSIRKKAYVPLPFRIESGGVECRL
jgi:glyoxylase-like metal-dependent hydrolase (beta-lactamase superfamily II)